MHIYVRMCFKSVHCSLCTEDVGVVVVVSQRICIYHDWSSHSSHVADLVDLHTLVAEHCDVGHGAVKADSLMEQGVVGRDKSRRGQPAAKPAAHPVWRREWHEDQEHESHRERDRRMLARVKEFDWDSDIGIESNLRKQEFDQEFDQELKDCVAESRRA